MNENGKTSGSEKNKIKLLTKPPRRTPLIISEKIKHILNNKVVCELGCAEGDNLLLMSKYAKKVIGLDLNPNRLRYAKDRNLDVRIFNYRLELIPEAEVYYFWPSNSLRDTPYLVWKIMANSNFNGIIIFGSENAISSNKMISYIYSIFSHRYSFYYCEGPKSRENGIFSINIFYKSDILYFYYPILYVLTYLLRIYSYLKSRLKVIY